MHVSQRLSRSQVPIEETWDLSDIYASPAHWSEDAARIDGDIEALVAYQGRLAEGAQVLLSCLQAQDLLLGRLDRVHKYTYFNVCADGGSADNQAMTAQAQTLSARVQAARSFLVSELAALPEGTIERFMQDAPVLAAYRAVLEDVLARRPYRLLPESEKLLAALGEIVNMPETIWSTATAVDMACPPARDANGEEFPVSIAGYVFGHLYSPDRALRRSAYDALSAGLSQVKATLATALAKHIQQNVAMARMRGYASATEMILAKQQVPAEVYHSVLDVVHDEIAPHVRRLARLRARVCGLERLERYDLEAPIDPNYTPATTYGEGQRMVQDALRILGDEYGLLIAAAFRDRWIDRSDNAGKGSGAFCWPVAGVHPYVFTTWRDTLRNAFTLAHELGHGGHYTAILRHQPISTFTIEPLSLLLEAPSTANELLLAEHLLRATNEPRMRRWIIQQSLGTFTHNMVTHMLEGHFERRLYQLAEAGKPLTLATIMEVQGEVFERFFAGTVVIDEKAQLYWMQQPHFYMNHYSYTYAAGVASGYAAVRAIYDEGQPAVDRWLQMLTVGSSLPPLEALRRAGIDFANRDVLRQAVSRFGALVDELEQGFGS
jgi:oligoendopeptidase F